MLHRVISFFLILLSLKSIGQDTVFVTSNFEYQNISKNLGMAVANPDDNFFTPAIQAIPFVEVSEKSIPIGNGAYWLKWHIKNNSYVQQHLVIGTSKFDYVQLYYVDSNGVINNAGNGLKYPHDRKSITAASYAYLPFHLEKNNEQTIYLWVKNKIDFQYAPLDFTLYNRDFLERSVQSENDFTYFFFGAIILMTLYNLVLYFQLRKSSYLYYVALNSLILLFVLGQAGFLDLWFFKDGHYHEKLILIFGNLFFCMYMIFSMRILNFRRFDKPWYIRIRIGLIAYIGLLLLLFLDYNLLAVYLGAIGAIVGFTIIFVATIKSIRLGFGPAKYFLIGNLCYVTSNTLSILIIIGVFSPHFFGITTIQIIETGTMIQLAIFSLSLGASINVMKDKLVRKEIEQEKQKQREQARYARLIEEKNSELEIKVLERTKELASSAKIIQQKNQDIMDSLSYAQRIQNAILPHEDKWKKSLPNSFVLYRPKEIISGDFYWVTQKGQKTYVAACDCTGHGIPGAMVSVLGHTALNRCVNELKLTEPAKILDRLTLLVEESFESSHEDEVNDGMDIALCVIVKKEDHVELQYAGANNPIWIFRKETQTFEEIKADKQPIGKFHHRTPFTPHNVVLNTGDRIFLFSDGYADQFGGPKGKKFKLKQLRELLLEIKDLPLDKQKTKLDSAFIQWKGLEEQVDDVCFIGIEV